MSERYDVTLGGKGYMVRPGSYRRRVETLAATQAARPIPPVRIVQREWDGGSFRAIQKERNRYRYALNLRPRTGFQTLGPGAARAAVAYGTGQPTSPVFWAVAQDAGQVCFAQGEQLLRLPRAGGLNPDNLGAAVGLYGVFGDVASGLVALNTQLLYMARSGADVLECQVIGPVNTLRPVGAMDVAVYNGFLWALGFGSAGDGNKIARVSDVAAGTLDPAATFRVDGPPHYPVLYDDALYFATPAALWRITHSTQLKADGTVVVLYHLAPALQAPGGGNGATFKHLTTYGGRLATFYAGEVMLYGTDGFGRGRLTPTGLRAADCTGLCVADDLLVAGVIDDQELGGYSLWAYDGRGWWCLDRDPGAAPFWAPFGGAGFYDNAQVLSLAFGQQNVRGWQTRPLATQAGRATSGELVTSLLYGQEPDQLKTWTKVGASLVGPGRSTGPGLPSFTACTVTLSYSTDGTNFTAAGSASVDRAAETPLEFTLPAGVTGRALALKYALTGVDVGDDGPDLAVLWAEYLPPAPAQAPAAAVKRRWTLDVLVGDDLALRDGRAEVRSGAQVAADLWAAWEAGAPLTFRDLDYDLAPVERMVTIAGLDERAPEPAGRGRWGEGVVTVTLVEE